jgi:hypothetical protein
MEAGMRKSDLSEYFAKIGRKGGKTGGKAAAARMTPKERSERARKAGLASGKARRKKESQ